MPSHASLISSIVVTATNIHFSNYPQGVALRSTLEDASCFPLLLDLHIYVKERLCIIKTDTSFIPTEAIF